MTPEIQAAAMWGSALNEQYPFPERLVFALQALEFYGNQYDYLKEQVRSMEDDLLTTESSLAAAEAEVRRMSWP